MKTDENENYESGQTAIYLFIDTDHILFSLSAQQTVA